MPTNRIIPSVIVAAALTIPAFAQSPAPGQDPAATFAPSGTVAAPKAAEAPPTEAEKTIDEAIAKVEKIESVAAEINLDADMLGQTFQVVGQYLRAPGRRVLLRLTVQGLGDVTGTTQQVCDGTTLWDYSQILENRFISRLSIEPVLKVLEQPNADPEFRRQFLNQLGFNGPEALLRGLRQSIAFDQKSEETLDGRDVWVLRGNWKDRAALSLPGAPQVPPQALADPAAIAGAAAFLPPYVPSITALYLDKETGWPVQLVMQGHVPSVLRDDRVLGPNGRPVGRKNTGPKERPTSIKLRYAVLRDREVKQADFQFTPPPNLEVQDNTQQFVSQLEAQVAEAAARKRSEAGDAGDLLDAPLTAPSPGAPPAPAPVPAPGGGGGAPNPGSAPPAESFRSSAPPRS